VSPVRPLALLLALATPALAADPDPIVRAQLESRDIKFDVDADGDFKMIFPVGKTGRTQLVFVRTATTQIGGIKLREIWSPAYRAPDDEFPCDVANKLLLASQDYKLGGWVRQGPHAVFVVKLAAESPVDELFTALRAAIESADAMERQLTGRDDF